MAQRQLPNRTERISIRHDGLARHYLLHMPPNATGSTPVVLEIHGRGIDPLRFDRMTGFMDLADRHGFAVAAPAAIGELWNDGRPWHGRSPEPDDIGFLGSVLEDVARRVAADEHAIYVVGMSNGASMIGRLICQADGSLVGRIAAAAQVAGTVVRSVVEPRSGRPPLPLLEIHGTSDPYWPYEGGFPHGVRRRILQNNSPTSVLGVDEWAELLIRANEARQGAAAAGPSDDTSLRRWDGSTPTGDLAFYRVDGGGHTWPGARITLPGFIFGRTTHTFDATEVIWSFFSNHRRESA